MTKQPNIVMIIAEELRADMLGYMGCECAETPFIDSLAESGVVFSKHHTVHSKCVPSRAALYSGRYIHVDGHRTLGIHLQQHEINLAKILRTNGYHTALCLKNHTVDETIMTDSLDERWCGDNLPGASVSYADYTTTTTSNDRSEGNKYGDNYLFGKLALDESDKIDYQGMRAAVNKQVNVICKKCNKLTHTFDVGLGDKILVDGIPVATIDMDTTDIFI